MKIRRHKSFEKDYFRLKSAQRERLKKAIALFVNDPSDAFGGDWRAHFKVVGGEAIFVACGTHAQLYK